MAGRIRSIKPELLEDAEAAGLSDAAWRLWVSIWTLVDDFGNTRSDARWLLGQVWWARTRTVEEVEAIIAELVDANRITLYAVRGQRFLHVRNWDKHQRIDNRGKNRVPRHDDEEAAEILREPPQDSEDCGSDPTTTNDTTADLFSLPVKQSDPESDACARVEGNPESARQEKLVRSHIVNTLSVFDAVVAARKRAKPGSRDLKPSWGALEPIARRFEAGYTMDDCLHVVAVYEREASKTRDVQYLDLTSPWRPENFQRAMGKDLGNGAGPRPMRPPLVDDLKYADEGT
jgi:hypothetical protein